MPRDLFGLAYKTQNPEGVKCVVVQWGRQYSQFSKTTLGQVVTTAFVVYLFASGLAFRLLNILFILWWLLPIIALPLARRRTQQASRSAKCVLQHAAQLFQKVQNEVTQFWSLPGNNQMQTMVSPMDVKGALISKIKQRLVSDGQSKTRTRRIRDRDPSA